MRTVQLSVWVIDVEQLEFSLNLNRTSDSFPGTVERNHEPVTGGLYFKSAVLIQLLTDDLTVGRQQHLVLFITQPREHLGGAFKIGKHYAGGNLAYPTL